MFGIPSPLPGAVIAAMAALLAAGCETAPVTLNSQFSADSVSVTPSVDRADAQQVCTVQLDRVTDSRMDPSTVGSVGPRVVKTPPNFNNWVRSAFLTLSEQGIHVVDSGQGAEAGGLGMDIDLIKAGVHSINTSIATTLVFKVRYLRTDALVKEAIYRGSDTSVNWASGDDEIQSHFDAVMQQVLVGARKDLAGLCTSPQAS